MERFEGGCVEPRECADSGDATRGDATGVRSGSSCSGVGGSYRGVERFEGGCVEPRECADSGDATRGDATGVRSGRSRSGDGGCVLGVDVRDGDGNENVGEGVREGDASGDRGKGDSTEAGGEFGGDEWRGARAADSGRDAGRVAIGVGGGDSSSDHDGEGDAGVAGGESNAMRRESITRLIASARVEPPAPRVFSSDAGTCLSGTPLLISSSRFP
uniref:hypothetical protein n=1 Tax=Burkholderia thailandensis TaxID=57975 RepID=UPI000FD6B834